MSDENAELTEGLEDEDDVKGGSKVALIAIVLLGIGGGGFAGCLLGVKPSGRSSPIEPSTASPTEVTTDTEEEEEATALAAAARRRFTWSTTSW